MAGKFPGPYINDVPAISGGTEGPMEYVESFATTGRGSAWTWRSGSCGRHCRR